MRKALTIMFLVMLVSLGVAGLWNKIPAISQTMHAILDPTAGALLNWDVNFGMVILVAIITLILTLFQKYTVDQETMREIKREQKLLQGEMKKYREHPEKMMELNKRSLELAGSTMELTSRPLIFTAVPIILFFRWFADYFTDNPVKIFGFFSWFWAYLIFSIIMSIIFRKVLKVQ